METPAANTKLLSFDMLCDAVANAAAIRIVTRLDPVGGLGDKIFPPTYEGGLYAEERVWMEGREVRSVLLDSVQSQANRMELALLAAYDNGKIKIPLIIGKGYLDAEGEPKRRITALEAPHRCHSAIFRESLFDGAPFRDSLSGKRLYSASLDNATPLLELCPHALIFGAWDSTMSVFKPGYLGPKFERAITSEIVGYDARLGVSPGGALDPLGIERAATIYETVDGNWTPEEREARKDKDGNPVPFSRGSSKKQPGRPSLINFGNVTPSFRDPERKDRNRPGGITIAFAKQTTVLSLIALRRLHFPSARAKANPVTDLTVQTLLAALALCAITYARRDGYDLRSRCVLIPTDPARFELVGSDAAQITIFSLDPEGATALFNAAAGKLAKTTLGWHPDEILLTPSPRLLALDRKSRELKKPDADENGESEGG